MCKIFNDIYICFYDLFCRFDELDYYSIDDSNNDSNNDSKKIYYI